MLENNLTKLEDALNMGLLSEEYDKICEILNRVPNYTELSIFSVMWSEHCSYKNSIIWLKKLPKTGKQMLVEAGEENAGLVDIGDGLACAFNESWFVSLRLTKLIPLIGFNILLPFSVNAG